MEVISISDSVHRVVLAGRLDTGTVGSLEIRFTAALSSATTHTIVDLTNCEFCGSLAIRMFLSVARVAKRRGREFVIAGAQPHVMEVFETVALPTLITMYPTVDDAVAQLAGR